jgi:predicted transcriptional regulator
VRKLGYTATDLAQRIGLSQPAVSISVQRGEALAREREIEILDREESFGNAV